MDELMWPILIPVSAIIGGITYAIVKTRSMARIRELEVRERIAMIERGLVPSPEANPRGFERAMRMVERLDGIEGPFGGSHRGTERHRTAAITLMGVGFGLMFLIALTNDDADGLRTAVGVGGFLVIMGLAFMVNSLLSRKSSVDRPDPNRPVTSQPPPPPAPGPLQPVS